MSLSIEESTPVPESPVAEGLAVRVRGLVQGVGFRPHVARLAQALGVDGDVCNDGEGVLIHLWATAAVRAAFLARLEDEAPPLARIEAVETWPLHDTPPHGFSIRTSEHGAVRTGVVPDAATCDACLRELFDPADRRYRYPFINCTHCGPRLSIQRQVPYDRAGTSMAGFVMCDACRREYEDAGDRRYHAQPNACPVCGPRVWLEPTAGNTALEGEDAVAAAATWLRQGAILAVKGLGGFHLACDAANAAAVNRLRAAKRRYAKPFALMARDPGVIRRYADCDAIEAGLLASPAAPIVLLNAREDAALPEGIAPGQDALGFMLPYTPLHHLLLAGFETPLVMTSGNLSDEPQCIDNDEARERLSPLVDGLLLHDRDIVNRVDDSVVRVVTGKARLLRRARGYVPAPLPLPPGFEQAPPVLALGGELKSTFCLFKEGQAILSPHLGDLEDARVQAAYEEVLDRFQGLFDFRPACLAGDAHPGYLSTQLGRDRAGRDGLTFTPVQHHHAHIAACLAENGWSLNAGPVLGIALDGLGYGEDATLWGGEFLRADYRAMHRLAALQPVALPGGVRAILEPWRLTYAQLVRLPDWSELRERYASL
ncbi:MAG: carbamoyltransferase HypF, partial [Acidihalobacter sp.]